MSVLSVSWFRWVYHGCSTIPCVCSLCVPGHCTTPQRIHSSMTTTVVMLEDMMAGSVSDSVSDSGCVEMM